MIGKPAMSPEAQKSIDAALDKADTLTLITSLLWRADENRAAAWHETDAEAGCAGQGRHGHWIQDRRRQGHRTERRRADGFRRINGRWYVEPPQAREEHPPAEQSRRAPASRTTATGKNLRSWSADCRS